MLSNIYNTRNCGTHTKGSYRCNPITHFHKHSVKIRRSSLLINDTLKSKIKLLKDTRAEESHYRKLVFIDGATPAQHQAMPPYQWYESDTCGVHVTRVTRVWVECCNVDTMTPGPMVIVFTNFFYHGTTNSQHTITFQASNQA